MGLCFLVKKPMPLRMIKESHWSLSLLLLHASFLRQGNEMLLKEKKLASLLTTSIQ